MAETVVYLAYDKWDGLLYIGSTGDFPARQAKHRAQSGWWPQVAYWDFEHIPTRQDAYTREAQLIRELRPRYNRQSGLRGQSSPDPLQAARAARDAVRDEQIIRLREQGKYRREIMRELGLGWGTTAQHLKRLLAEGRITRRPSGQPVRRKPA